MFPKNLRNMFFNQLSIILRSVISLATRVPDRLLEMVWKAVMCIAPIHTNVPIDIKSLFTWNVIPYRSSKVPVSRWAEFLKASHEYQEAVKEEIWVEVKENIHKVKISSIEYIEGKDELESLYPYICIVLKTLKSFFQLVKAKECYKVSIQALHDLEQEMKKDEHIERESLDELGS